jgi:hypothetical protein
VNQSREKWVKKLLKNQELNSEKVVKNKLNRFFLNFLSSSNPFSLGADRNK